MSNSSSPAPRRFLPQPEETTTTHRRKFVPEPLETTTKTSRVKQSRDASDPSEDSLRRKPLPEPVDTTVKSHRKVHVEESERKEANPGRRFLPEPVEIIVKTHKGKASQGQASEARDLPKKRFLPEPVETTFKTHRYTPSGEAASREDGSRRFRAEPIETTVNSHRARRKGDHNEHDSSTISSRRWLPETIETDVFVSEGVADSDPTVTSDSQTSRFQPLLVEQSAKTRRRKKFSPQLIETASRSRRNGDPEPAVLPLDTTERSPGDTDNHSTVSPPPYPTPPSNTPFASSEDVPLIEESRFSSASLSRKQTRSHSFRIPDLPSIIAEDEESDSSAVPSLSTSASAESDTSGLYKHASRLRESCDDRFSGYLLQLAARAAEKQLKDQVMAAYPNEKDHQPVDHFAIDSDDSGDEARPDIISRNTDIDITAFRRESAADLGWEIKEMRKHQRKLSQEKKAQKERDEAEWLSKTATQVPFQSASQTAKQVAQANNSADGPKNIIGGWQKGVGLTQMRSAASPPMLGGDLVFPKCLSPKSTRLDVDQFPVPGKHAGEEAPTGPEEAQLWLKDDKGKTSNPGSGLWMGCCAKAHNQPHSLLTPPTNMKSGIITPLPERNDSIPDAIDEITILDMRQLPPSPPSSQPDARIEGIDRMLYVEQEIDDEFNDAFVTQIYNYLSLGYSSLARPFDEELSKISRIPISELRRDDQRVNAKGYVGAPEGDGVDHDVVVTGQCSRWTALRLYIREWARQQPGMAEHKTGMDAWGVGARRGSWAH